MSVLMLRLCCNVCRALRYNVVVHYALSVYVNVNNDRTITTTTMMTGLTMYACRVMR